MLQLKINMKHEAITIIIFGLNYLYMLLLNIYELIDNYVTTRHKIFIYLSYVRLLMFAQRNTIRRVKIFLIEYSMLFICSKLCLSRKLTEWWRAMGDGYTQIKKANPNSNRFKVRQEKQQTASRSVYSNQRIDYCLIIMRKGTGIFVYFQRYDFNSGYVHNHFLTKIKLNTLLWCYHDSIY